ncbi:MAG: DUF4097 family beta strand repeat protein [Candidatus Aminicenantes bacterium]|nr:DUF4097 family beta strand repeat protein [Candidatus Aminicenantes bacterium]
MGFYTAEATADERYEEKFERTVSLAKDGKVTLANITGSIDVKSWDRDEVKINALKISKASTLSEAKENANSVKIVVKKEGNTLQIKTEYPEGREIWRRKSLNVSVNYSLVIPAKASAKIDSVTGNVDLEEIGGAAKVEVVTGNATLEKNGGAVKVEVVTGAIVVRKADKGVDCETVTGKIEVQNITGDAFLKTVTGRITASQIKGSIKFHVVTGRVELSEVSEASFVDGEIVTGSFLYDGKIKREGRYTINIHTGKIEMILPGDSGFDLEANTFSGRIETDFEIKISGKISKKRISGVVNEGGALVKLSTFSGNIYLKKK